MASTHIDQRRRSIAVLNDLLRRNGYGGLCTQTPAIAALPEQTHQKVVVALRNFDEWTPDNDPYGEHDCALFEVDGMKYLFKIDYFADSRCLTGCENPDNPEQSYRVLTLMFANEY